MATSTIFDGFILLAGNVYMKPCGTHPSAYDLYVYKPSKSPRHPEGKMDDVAFGLSLELAIKWACHKVAGEREVKDLQELLKELSKVNKEINENVLSFIND